MRYALTFGQHVLDRNMCATDSKHFPHVACGVAITAARRLEFLVLLEFGKYLLHVDGVLPVVVVVVECCS